MNNPLKYTDPSGELPLWAGLLISWAGNYVIGWLDNVINKGMSPKDAFKYTTFVMGFNWSPADFNNKNHGVSNQQVDAQESVAQQAKVMNNINQQLAGFSGWNPNSGSPRFGNGDIVNQQFVGDSPLADGSLLLREITWDLATNRRINTLDSRLIIPVTNFINAAQSQGVNLRITQGFRSFARQDDLYNQGRTTPGKIVTNARGGQSYHNYGLAFDVVIMQNGQPVWDRIPSGYSGLS